MSNDLETRDVINKSKEYLENRGNEAIQKGAKEIKESGKDWWCYVENHPIQSMIFGVIGYFAVKGLFKG